MKLTFLGVGKPTVVQGAPWIISAPMAPHRHDASDIDNLPGGISSIAWTAVTGKPTAFTPSAHSHDWSSITGKPGTFPAAAHTHAWTEITSKPATFAPAPHRHDASEIDNLPTGGVSTAWADLTGVPASFPPSTHAHAWADVTGKPAVIAAGPDAAAARAAIGAGTSSLVIGTTASTAKAGDYAPTWAQVTGKPTTFTPATHSHAIADVGGLQAALDAILSRLDTLEDAPPPATGTGTVATSGSLPALRVQGDTGTLAVPTSTAFTTTGDAPAYSLVSPPAGVTINAATGVVSIPTATRRANAQVRVRAAIGANNAEQSFSVTTGARLGIACPKNEIFGNTASELTFIFNRFRDMGISEFRTDLIWMDIQPSNATVNWNAGEALKYTQVADAAAAAGIDLIFCVHMTPSWARLSGANYNGPGTPSAFASFCASAAAHFTSGGRRLIGMEIWNEPNLTGPNTFWQYGRPASELAAMQIAAYPAIKAVSQNIKVGMGGMSAVPSTRNPVDPNFQYIAATEWLSAMYAAGFKDYNDFLAIHPYTYPYPWNDGVSNNDGLEVTLACRTVAANNGDSGKEWWFTEYGAPTNPPTSDSRARTEAQQAQMFRDIFDWSGANSWASKIHWYSYYDRTASGGTTEDAFGIFRNDEMTAKQIVADIQAVRKGG